MSKKLSLHLVFLIAVYFLTSCHLPIGGDAQEDIEDLRSELGVQEVDDVPLATDSSADLESLCDPESIPARAFAPEDLAYRGAFRLPDDSVGMGWDYSGHGMSYFPDGDVGGDDDGYPGSLFIVGHDQQLWVGEVSIPAPVDSRNLEDLNVAQTLQSLSDISGGIVTDALVLPRMGIEYLPAIGGMPEEKLHFAIGQHIQGFEPSHGWASTDLDSPNPEGLWLFDGFTNYATNDYLFEIPEEWSAAYTPGYRLACGRFREGVWGGLGPALFAYAPWLDGNPPLKGDRLGHVIPLLLYGQQAEGMPELVVEDRMRMQAYAESDHWWGGAWLTASCGESVILTGTKALGKSWYGFANGVVWDYACMDDPAIECPEIPNYPYDDRGFWAEDYQPSILFFDPADLARVAKGEIAAYEPQPYALMDLSDYWFDPEINLEIYKRDLVGAAAFDRGRGILYIIERLGDETKSVVHVFQIQVE